MTDDNHRQSAAIMGTIVSIEGPAAIDPASIERAFEWFYEIEKRCSRFEPDSELMNLTAHIGVPIPVSPILYEAVQFALAIAEESEGAFDPTVGYGMETRGFNKEHRSGRAIRTPFEHTDVVSYRDVRIDGSEHTITLLRPLVLDLGAVAKGLAIDMAVRELQPVEHFVIDAGGDLYLKGTKACGRPWTVGIRHPEINNAIIESISVSNSAVCTSGHYERGNHILNPRSGNAAHAASSVTVVAPTAMLADAAATAAFVLGPDQGIRFLDRLGVDGLIFSSVLDRYATHGLCHG